MAATEQDAGRKTCQLKKLNEIRTSSNICVITSGTSSPNQRMWDIYHWICQPNLTWHSPIIINSKSVVSWFSIPPSLTMEVLEYHT